MVVLKQYWTNIEPVLNWFSIEPVHACTMLRSCWVSKNHFVIQVTLFLRAINQFIQSIESLKEEDVKKEPKIEPKKEPKTEPKEEPKTEPKEEPEEEPTDIEDVDEMMAEAEADIPRWRSEMEARNTAENNNGKDKTEYVS